MRHILLGFGMLTALAACGDPLRGVARLGDVNASDATTAVAEAPSEARTNGGLFGRLLNRSDDDPTNAAIEAALSDAGAVVDETSESAQDGVISAPEPVVAEPVVADPPRRGLAGLFTRNPANARPRTGPDAADVPAGTVMPFGEIARVCGLRANELGTRIDAAAGVNIYDTIPNSTAPRPFYITGFADDCARTFTGAVVVSGDVETHEFVRYRPSNERIAYTTTDNAYEALKASVCRVGRGQPCGERTARLDRDTRFITVYNFFGGTFSAVPTKWAQILIHDGEVMAMSIKNGQ